jgi:metal-dependent amidase/aminoacylase/carboxypeptidase family protein
LTIPACTLPQQPSADEIDQFLTGVSPEDALVCTVGALAVWPGASNVIPGSANFTVDVRSRSDAVREAVVADVTAGIAAICNRCLQGVRV